MITIQKILKTQAWPFLFIMLLAGFLFAEEKKDLPPAPPEILKGCDQNQPQNSPSDTSISSPTPSSKEKAAEPDPSKSSPLLIQPGPENQG
ncbi:MAG: hypothetical protein ABSE95_02535 [Thermodesulfobacteriota bacterium]